MEPRQIKFPAKYYWGVHVTKEVCKAADIFLYADHVIVKDGDLTFYCDLEEGGMQPCFSVPKGFWRTFFSASLIDGAPVKVEHWEGIKGGKSGIR